VEDEVTDYIDAPAAFAERVVAPIGFRKPHVGISRTMPGTNAISLAPTFAIADNSGLARKAQPINGGSPRIAAS
jgi:hypothetical protein